MRRAQPFAPCCLKVHVDFGDSNVLALAIRVITARGFPFVTIRQEL
jgi:hypothetical protein